MNKRYIVLAIAASCLVANGQSNYCANMTNGVFYANGWVYDIPVLIKKIESSKQIKELVETLARTGKICEVCGHNWRPGRRGESETIQFADYHPDITYQTCRVCGWQLSTYRKP